MSDELKRTIKIKRGETAAGDNDSDNDARNVWTKPIEEVELELVSTVMLKGIIDSGDQEQNNRIRELAAGEDGVLARSTDTNELEVISESEVEASLEPLDAAAELSLVSTQALRKLLKTEDEPEDAEAEADAEPGYDAGKYNPYDSG